MNLNGLPREILTRCFSFLRTELLTDIILLDNIPDHILEAAANNINHIWYTNKVSSFEVNAIIKDHYDSSFDHDKTFHDRYHFETEFDRFVNIHKMLEKKSVSRPLWFHYEWENIFEMRRTLDEINSAFKGQKLGIYADLTEMPSDCVRFFSDHDMNLKITCLSLNFPFECRIDLNNFPNLETFYGKNCKITVDHTHPSLKNLYLKWVTFSSLPVNLEKLVARNCHIRMEKDHPKLEGLRVLVLQDIYPVRPFLLQKLWNKDLETFSYIEEKSYYDYDPDYRWVERDEVMNPDDVMSMIGPKVTNFGFNSSSFSGIPTSLHSLYSDDSKNESSENHIRSFDLTAFTHMTSLTLKSPQGLIDTFKLPPNLLKLSISKATFQDFERISLPPRIVDLELTNCHITSTAGWLKPARLKRLSLAHNDLSSFKAFLPCCEYLCLKFNPLTDLEIEAPALEHIHLFLTGFSSIPKLPDSLQVLIIRGSDLRLSGMLESPSSLKVLIFFGTLDIKDYTFPPSIEKLYLGGIDELKMSGVKFAKGSKLKELDLSDAGLPDIDWDDATDEERSYMWDGGPFGGPQSLTIINDGMIELPPGLKALKMRCLCLRYIDDFTIPQSVTFLDLRENHLSSFEVRSHIETLYLGVFLEREWNRELNFVVHKDSELRVLDLEDIGLTEFSFDMVRAEKLEQLHLGPEVEKIDLSNMPVDFQVLEYRGAKEIEGLHRYPDTNIYTRLP